MWRALLFFALFAVATAQSSCGTPDSGAGTCVCNGTLYNMSNFRDAQGSTFFQGTDGDYRYFFSMIDGGLPRNFTNCTLPATGSAAAQHPLNFGSTCYSIGLASQQMWDLVAANDTIPQMLMITFTGGDEGRMTRLTVVCDLSTTATGFMALGESPSLIYDFEARSCAACPGINPCSTAPPPPPSPPPPPPPSPGSSCIAAATSEPWGNRFGGIEGFSQGSVPTSSKCGLQYRVYAYKGVSGPAISHEDNVFTANTDGVLLTRHERPIQLFRLPGGSVVSNIALLSDSFHVVTANQSAVYLHSHTLSGQGADTMVLLAQQAAPSHPVTVLTDPNTGGVYVHVDATIYRVVAGKVQSTFALPTGPTTACLALTRNATHLVVGTPTAAYGLDPLTLSPTWALAGLPAVGCPLLYDITALFYNETGFTLVDVTVGRIAATLPVTSGCTGQAVFTTRCWLVCPNGPSSLVAFDAFTHANKWVLDVSETILDVVADNSTAVLVLSLNTTSQSVTLRSLDLGSGTTTWLTRLPGRGGSIGLDGEGGINVFTTGSDQSYVYGFGPHGEGVPCPK